jgi:hypothetical protein
MSSAFRNDIISRILSQIHFLFEPIYAPSVWIKDGKILNSGQRIDTYTTSTEKTGRSA